MDLIQKTQHYLKKENMDGWLLYYFDHNNPHALDFLQLSPKTHISRRIFYWIPAEGPPVKILHAIEQKLLDHLPGEKQTYDSLQSLIHCLKTTLQNASVVAMEYSPCNDLPYISKVDAGTKEMVELQGVEVVSSAPFLIYLNSTLSQNQILLHQKTAQFLEVTAQQIFDELELALDHGKKISEYHLQQKIIDYFGKNGYVSCHDPICAFGKNTADPHYSPTATSSSYLEPQMPIMIDIFCKRNEKEAIYADITKMGFSAQKPSKEFETTFSLVKHAQQLAYDLLAERLSLGQTVKGCALDQVARKYLHSQNVGEFFRHRLGHNIHQQLHGPGTHLDSFETFDDRPLIPSTCFSIEPGIYYPGKFGVRLEYDVLILPDSTPSIQGGKQETIVTFSAKKKPLTTTSLIL